MKLQEIKGLPKIGDTASSAPIPMATEAVKTDSNAVLSVIPNTTFKISNPLNSIPVSTVVIPVINTQQIPTDGGSTVTSPAKPTDTVVVNAVDFSNPNTQYFFKYSVAALGSQYSGKDAALDNFIALLFSTDLQNLNSVNGIGNWFDKAGQKVKDAYNALSDAAKKIADELAAKAADIAKALQDKLIQLQNYAKEQGPSISASLQKAWDITKKVSPPLVLARNSYLVLLKLNLFGWASLWNYGRIDDNQAALLNLSPEFREKCKQGYQGLVNKWNSWGGDVSALNTAIEQGSNNKPLFDVKSNAKISGIGIDPATDSAIAGALTIIGLVAGIIREMRGPKDKPADASNPTGDELDPTNTGLNDSNSLSQIQAGLTALSQFYNQSKSVMTDAEQAKYAKEIARLQTLLAVATAAANAAQSNTNSNTNSNPNTNTNSNTNNNNKPTSDTPFYKTTAGVVTIIVGTTAVGTLIYYAVKPKKTKKAS